MKVLLCRPPRRDRFETGLCVPPLGLAYVASALISAGHSVSIIDAHASRISWRRFVEQVADEMADVIGFTAMTPTADVTARAVALCRPYARFLMIGGPHPTAVGAAVFDEMPELDAAIKGEGEMAAPALLSWLEDGASGDPPPGSLVPDRPFTPGKLPNIDQISWPARELLPMSRYRYLFSTRRGFATIITSRGCPFQCSFCDKSVSGSRWRARKPVDIVDEMAFLVENYGVGFINIYDDNFLLHRSRVEAICDEIRSRNLKVEWKCEGRVDSVDVELLSNMRSAGCRVVAYGVESGNRESLAFLRKDIALEQTISAFSATRDAGLRSLAYIILGVPGEDESDVRRTIRFCREIGADYAQFSTLNPTPGTPIYSLGAQEISVTNPLDADLHRRVLSDIPPERLQGLMRQAWLGFYLRPKAFSRLAIDAYRSGSLGEGARMAAALGRWAVGRRHMAT